MKLTFHIPNAISRVIAEVHNSEVGHHGLQMCKKRLKANGYNFTDRMITQLYEPFAYIDMNASIHLCVL